MNFTEKRRRYLIKHGYYLLGFLRVRVAKLGLKN